MANKMIEAHFFGLPSQSNIYGLTSLMAAGGTNKIIVASLKRKVYCVEYAKNCSYLIPSTREVHFTYIPGGAEIISIDAFNQTCHEHEFVVGITFVKGDSSGNHTQYFNIYSDWEPGTVCDLDNIAQGCLSLVLDFIPYQLTHTQLVTENSKEVVWLLSGSDCKVHLYREDKEHHSFCEEPIVDYFPEFEKLSSIVQWMDFMILNKKRITAVGCEDGFIYVSLVNTAGGISIESSWSLQHDSPISVVRLFTESSLLSPPPFMSPLMLDWDSLYKDDTKLPVHLLVGNMLEPCVVYRNILEFGLNNAWLLPDSEKFDCVTTACITDIDMDGYNELLLGTYGQNLLVYKWKKQISDASGSDDYALQWQKTFPYPLLSLLYIDITDDGMKELLVLSTKGLHILQHDHQDVAKLVIQRLKKLMNTDE